MMNDRRGLAAPPEGSVGRIHTEQRAQEGVAEARRTIAVLGDVWTLRILRTVFRGKRRYGDFVAEFGVSRAVLTDRLGKLVEQGVLVRHAPDGGHPRSLMGSAG